MHELRFAPIYAATRRFCQSARPPRDADEPLPSLLSLMQLLRTRSAARWMQAFAASRSVSILAVAAARSFETISLAQEQVGLFTSIDIEAGEYSESDIDSSYWGQRLGTKSSRDLDAREVRGCYRLLYEWGRTIRLIPAQEDPLESSVASLACRRR